MYCVLDSIICTYWFLKLKSSWSWKFGEKRNGTLVYFTSLSGYL